MGTELCGGEPLTLVALQRIIQAPALPPTMRSVVQHARLGTPPAEEARVTGIMDPNIAKRIREKTVHLRQRLATTSAAHELRRLGGLGRAQEPEGRPAAVARGEDDVVAAAAVEEELVARRQPPSADVLLVREKPRGVDPQRGSVAWKVVWH